MSVPCGTRSTARAPLIICCWVSELRPIWLAITWRTSPALISLPIPTPGTAGSLAITVRSRLPLPDNLIDYALGRADAHEPTDQQARAIGDFCDGLFGRDCLHRILLSQPQPFRVRD